MASGIIKTSAWQEVGTLTDYSSSLTIPDCDEILFLVQTESGYGIRILQTALVPRSYFDQVPIGNDQNTNGIVVLFDGTTGIIFPIRSATNEITGRVSSAANGKSLVIFVR